MLQVLAQMRFRIEGESELVTDLLRLQYPTSGFESERGASGGCEV